jgi:uncharacterized membrane protein
MFNFLKNSLVRGLVILIPLVILFVTFRELLEIMVGLATPIVDLFPEDTFNVENETEILAILLIIGTAIVLGTVAAIKPARIAGSWFEQKTLDVIPMYRMLKSLMSAMLNIEDEQSFKPAFFHASNGTREPVYVVENRGEGLSVVMCPWSPTPFAGSVKVVQSDRLELLPVTLDEFSLALTHFGLGMSDVIQKKVESGRPEPGNPTIGTP